MRVCRDCKQPYEPFKAMQPRCIPCAIAKGKIKTQKDAALRERIEKKRRKEKLKTRSDWMKEAQAAFNAWVRARDKHKGYACISSGRALDWTGNGVDAGHYRSVGSAPHLRFDEQNCHAQSKKDNRYGAGCAVDYRIGLIKRIGLAAVERLEADNDPRKHTIEELRFIRDLYRERVKILKEETNA